MEDKDLKTRVTNIAVALMINAGHTAPQAVIEACKLCNVRKGVTIGDGDYRELLAEATKDAEQRAEIGEPPED